MNTHAVLVVSFGTSYESIITRCIEPVEHAIYKALSSDYDLYRAFTSRMIIKKLKRENHMNIKDPVEALTSLAQKGYQEIIIQPTHILAGSEYHDLKKEVHSFNKKYPHIKLKFGQSILYENEDYIDVIQALKTQLPEIHTGEALLLMGHGSEHFSNASYFELQYFMTRMLDFPAYIANVEAEPTLESVIETLKAQNISSVQLMPFMLVCGDHAHNDMMGPDEDSWLNLLKNAGFDVHPHLIGLGENEQFCHIYGKKALRTLKK